MLSQFAPQFRVWAGLVAAAVLVLPCPHLAFAASAPATPVVQADPAPQDAVSAEEIASDFTADPIHPWDNNGLSDTTDLSSQQRPHRELKPLTLPSKRESGQEQPRVSAGVTLPDKIEFVRNLPNPFNAQTRIEFALTQAGRAKLEIYNLLGQVQHRVEWSHLDAGVHSWLWQGVSSEGASLPSGVYFYRIEVDQASAIGKMVLLK